MASSISIGGSKLTFEKILFFRCFSRKSQKSPFYIEKLTFEVSMHSFSCYAMLSGASEPILQVVTLEIDYEVFLDV